MNTLSLQLGDEGDLQEYLENVRIAASKMSPMMKACNLVSTYMYMYLLHTNVFWTFQLLRQCLPHIDSEVLADLVPQLVAILKSGVGLGTKVREQ